MNRVFILFRIEINLPISYDYTLKIISHILKHVVGVGPESSNKIRALTSRASREVFINPFKFWRG